MSTRISAFNRQFDDSYQTGIMNGTRSLDTLAQEAKLVHRETNIFDAICKPQESQNTLEELVRLKTSVQMAIGAKTEYYKSMSIFKRAALFLFDATYRNDRMSSQALVRADKVLNQINRSIRSIEKARNGNTKVVDIWNKHAAAGRNFNSFVAEMNDNEQFKSLCQNQKMKQGQKATIGNYKFLVLDSGVHCRVGSIGEGNIKKASVLFNVHTGQFSVQSKAKTKVKTPEGRLQRKSDNEIAMAELFMRRAVSFYDQLKNAENVIKHISSYTFKKHSENSYSGIFKKLYEWLLQPVHHCFIEKYYRQGNLDSTVEKLTPAERLEAMKDMAKGVQALHSKGIIHRDVKPSNVLTNGKKYVLADFDTLVTKSWKDYYFVQAGAGTPGYIAPNIVITNGVNELLQYAHTNMLHTTTAADIYSLGVAFYHISRGLQENKLANDYLARRAGQSTYIRQVDQHVHHQIVRNLSLFGSLDRLIAKMIDVDQDKRPTIDDVISELNKITMI